MAGFWGRSRRAEEKAQQDEQDRVLADRAASALVSADERLRLTRDELAFATAELGEAATRDLAAALASVSHHLDEAFRLHQLNVDDIPDTPQEQRERNARIVQLAEWATGLVEERTAALADQVARVREAPEVADRIRDQAAAIRTRLPQAHETLTRLAERYSPEALRQVAGNATEAEQLLGFAEQGIDVAARRRDAGQASQATLALEAATESVRRSAVLLDAVESFELEALRAQAALSAVVADSRDDLVAVRDVPATPEVAAAAGELQEALAALPGPGAPSDPFTDLTRLRAANSALDAAVARAAERAARPVPSAAQVRHAEDDAERQLAVARDVIAGHRGYIGADARTRLAEAERALTELRRSPSDEESREQDLALARRAADLAGQALALAQRDIDAGRDSLPGGAGRWDSPRRGGGLGGFGGPMGGRGSNDMGGLIGGVLGGMVLGEVLEDFFD
ncbi:MAG TPA: hypothetical protein DHV14_00225 [Micrococcales bacterium]|uniref:TPM domain-containing protein n=1 Tax=Miniimonas arenae TaxID=676201 RepID=A0A5C5BDJ9_9MICO|nr:hypothetical protein [Miniimonas arenae]TNU76538.1 hypothetical protein FH969_03150 [Miniimonas arenae]HCX83577.1 hypothetical protein [Micrococcales bacterium]